MTASEARAAWQRAANRFFVQEDAKRAPKLACCPSTPQHDSVYGNVASEPDYSATNFMPSNWNPKNSNLPPDTKWWLHLQPSYGCPKDFKCEQMDFLKDELGNKTIEHLVPSSKHAGESLSDNPMYVDLKRNDDYSLESQVTATTASMRHHAEKSVEEIKPINSNLLDPLECKVDACEYCDRDVELMYWKHADRIIFKKPEKALSNTELPSERENKRTAWWHISDKDELASLVAQKSSQHIENCDLPRPTQTVYVSSDPYASLERLQNKGIFSSSLGQHLHGGVCNPVDFTEHSSNSGSMDDKYWSYREPYHLHDNEKLHSGVGASIFTTKGSSESKQVLENDASRAQLLEALRRSQTRAREAEKAAQKAYNEKEHIVKLLFRQASHLFAYKQWLHILQLERLHLQLKFNEHQIPTLFPDLPWIPLKGRHSSKERRKGKKGKKCNICKKMVVFAIGLGLAGAGLLLGWTLGWLLACF